jgi:hypothetical protein
MFWYQVLFVRSSSVVIVVVLIISGRQQAWKNLVIVQILAHGFCARFGSTDVGI